MHVRLGDRPALAGLDAAFARGRLTAIVGPNGAGKSTILRVAVGLVRAHRGDVRIDDRPLASIPLHERAGLVGWVPQSADVRDPFTVREVVSMGRYAHRRRRHFAGPDPADRDAVDAALGAARLDGLEDRAVTTLSGGERQRVLIARALAQDPEWLLLDEPVASLDLGQAADLVRLLRVRAAAGRGVVAVVHDLELASRAADHIVVISAGRAVAAGAPRAVLTEPVLGAAFGTPVRVRWDEDGARVRALDPAEVSTTVPEGRGHGP